MAKEEILQKAIEDCAAAEAEAAKRAERRERAKEERNEDHENFRMMREDKGMLNILTDSSAGANASGVRTTVTIPPELLRDD